MSVVSYYLYGTRLIWDPLYKILDKHLLYRTLDKQLVYRILDKHELSSLPPQGEMGPAERDILPRQGEESKRRP